MKIIKDKIQQLTYYRVMCPHCGKSYMGEKKEFDEVQLPSGMETVYKSKCPNCGFVACNRILRECDDRGNFL